MATVDDKTIDIILKGLQYLTVPVVSIIGYLVRLAIKGVEKRIEQFEVAHRDIYSRLNGTDARLNILCGEHKVRHEYEGKERRR